MTPIKLKLHLARKGISIRKLAEITAAEKGSLRIGKTKLNEIINGGDATDPQQRSIELAAQELGIKQSFLFHACEDEDITEIQNLYNPNPNIKKEKHMPGQALFRETIDRFKIEERHIENMSLRLTKNAIAQPYMPKTLAALKNKIKSAIENLNPIAIVGPSGAGKTTLVKHVIKETKNRTFIRLRTVDISRTTITHIMQAIAADINKSLRGADLEIRSRNLFKDLLSYEPENTRRPVLILEDAQLLSIDVICALKLFLEWQDDTGMNMLGILLVAQPEIRKNIIADTQQFWKRCALENFPLLTKKAVVLYTRYHLENVSLDPMKIFKNGALEAFADRCTEHGKTTPADTVNQLIATMNHAALTQAKNPTIDKNTVINTQLTGGSDQ